MNCVERIKTVTDEKWIEIGKNNNGSVSNTLTQLTMHNGPQLRNYVIAKFKQLNIPRKHHCNKIKYSIADIREAVIHSICISDVIKYVGLTPQGYNNVTIKKMILNNNIDISHFDISSARKRGKKVWLKEDIFCIDSKYSRTNLRNAVFRFNILPTYCCAECNIGPRWNNKDLLIELDHINGINNDNRVSNLRWMCPNCHSQTEFHRSRKIRK